MSHARLLLQVLALVAAVGLAGCKGTSPKGAEEALGLNKDGKPAAVPGAAADTPAPPKPVPAEMPDVLARVNGDAKLDLVLYFRPRDVGLVAGDTRLWLLGRTKAGGDLGGLDTIRTQGCR